MSDKHLFALWRMERAGWGRRALALWCVCCMLFTCVPAEAMAPAEESSPDQENMNAGARILICGQEESEPVYETIRAYTRLFSPHRHEDACYDNSGKLICGIEAGAYVHSHNQWCRDADGKLVCGLETRKEHTHSDACYEISHNLNCGQEEDPGHTHSETCYVTREVLTCGLEESEGHAHSAACYTIHRDLTCGQEEDPGHSHTDACYTAHTDLTCGQGEDPGHTHSEACYTVTVVRELTCGQNERARHAHADACYTEWQELTCGQEEKTGHSHSADCRTIYTDLICGQEEYAGHSHSEDCYTIETRMTCQEIDTSHHHTSKCHAEDEKTVICGKTEIPVFISSQDNWEETRVVISEGHTHTESCYETISAEAAATPAPETMEELTDTPAPEATEELTETPAPERMEEPTAAPSTETTEEPAMEPTWDLTTDPEQRSTEGLSEEEQNVGQEPVEEAAIEDPTEEPSDETSDEPIAETSEEPMDEPSEEPTEDPTEKPSDDLLVESLEETLEEHIEEPSGELQSTDGAFALTTITRLASVEPIDAAMEMDTLDILDVAAELDNAEIPIMLSAGQPADTAVVNISMLYDKGKEPTVTEGVFLTAPEGLIILNTWVVDGFNGNKNPAMTAVLQAYPALALNEQLSFYAIVGQNKNKLQMDSSPLKENLLEGDSVSLSLSDKGSRGTYGIALVKSQIAMTSGKSIAPAVEAYESFTLSGTLPATAIADVTPVSAEIEGEDVLAACNISIFASAAQRQLNQSWQPDGESIQVTIQNAAFENKELNVFHIAADGAEPQLVDTVIAVNGTVSFHADSFSVYAVTETIIEKEITTSDGLTYKITVVYDQRARFSEGAELVVTEIESQDYLNQAANILGWEERDEVYYSKFLDISIQSEGHEIEPEIPVQVMVELLDVDAGAEALEIIHFSDNGAEAVESVERDESTFSFYANSFSVYGFESVLRASDFKETELTNIILYGFTKDAAVLIKEESLPEVEEGTEILDAFTIQAKDDDDIQIWLKAALLEEAELDLRETVGLYWISGEQTTEPLIEEFSESEQLISLGSDIDKVVIIKDTGYRHLNFEMTVEDADNQNGDPSVTTVVLEGMMPKDSIAQAADVTGNYNIDDFLVNVAFDAEKTGDIKTAESDKYSEYNEDTYESQSDNEYKPDIQNIDEDNIVSDTAHLEESQYKLIGAYDISIFEGDKEYQPDDLHRISVSIQNERISSAENLVIWHVHDDGSKEQVNDFNVENGCLTFSAESFSVYVIIDAPSPVEYGEFVTDIVSLTSERSAEGFYLSIIRNDNNVYYITQDVNDNGAFKVVKKENQNQEIPQNAAVWYFEVVDADNSLFRVYLLNGEGNKQYISHKEGRELQLKEDEDEGAIFKITRVSNTDTRFYFKLAEENPSYWMQYSGSGNGVRLYENKNDIYNPRIRIEFVSEMLHEKDPYGLDNQTYGLMKYKQGETKAIGMLNTTKLVNNTNRIVAKEMLIRTDPMDSNRMLYIPKDSDLGMWAFHCEERDKYTLTCDGKYLRLEAGNLTLTETKDDYCVFQVIPGTGTRSGQIQLYGIKAEQVVELSGNNVNNGFGGGSAINTADRQWLNLVTYSVYEESDFVEYFANKVSVSDSVNVTNGKQVVIYTRVWNDAETKYEFYAIDHNGNLLPCYESGDSIVWIGTQINTLLWEFTEYYRAGTRVPNGYYDLRNTYTGQYIGPQLGNGQIFADGAIGINLKGRQDGDYYTAISAWDTLHYDYAGYKVENGKIVSCPISQADTFYFAVMRLSEHELTPVATVDHASLGLTMKMIDFPNNTKQNAVLGSSEGGAVRTTVDGLLSSGIEEGASYPKTKTGASLGDLFAGAVTVNHLFIQSIYDGSGYYQFDSSENFAHLNGNHFDVYQELGAVKNPGNTHSHGQFMPYNTLDGSKAHADNPYNMTDIYGHELSDNYPRKYEPLYGYLEEDNSYFGMEIEGHFMQPANGHDAWGHDIIFEFVGDDDFWMYVDGELVIDLGGIHSALGATVNYSTGEVVVNNKTTTLYELFRNNYAGRKGLAEDSEEVQQYLDNIFHKRTVRGKECYVFKDYSSHTVRIFYMERGAGASNLRMRFNLASITPGQVLLTKEITGTEKQDFASVKFPFQIFYDEDNGEGYKPMKDRPPEGEAGTWSVVYQNTSTNVEYAETVTIDGVQYNHVFYLKPGQTAAITIPDTAITYYIQECGVNETIYDHVYVNDEEITAEIPTGSTNTHTYRCIEKSAAERARVTFSNHVNPAELRTLSITKKLFDESGNPLTAENDPAEFTFRLRLGEDLEYYNQDEYFVKNPDLYYCYFDRTQGGFVSIGKKNFEELTPDEITRITYKTSPSGAISQIPAGYTVEVRGLLVGTRFMVTEEDYDIPVGYGKRMWTEEDKNGQPISYYGYKRVEGSYLIEEGDTLNSGIIRDNNNPQIEIHNQRGHGIRANKVWSDGDFMLNHDDIYFAIYVKDTLLEGSVHRIDAYNYTTYFIPSIQEGTTFDDYKVYEVKLMNPVVEADGVVSKYDSIELVTIENSITIGGTRNDGTVEGGLIYSPSYDQGISGDSNTGTRIVTVTNTRVGGLRIIKEDDQGSSLAGVVFTLAQADGNRETFTSSADGLVTTAYLSDGEYTLTETNTPTGYQALSNSITISVKNGEYNVSCEDSNSYHYDDQTRTLTIINRTYSLKAIKIDTSTEEPLPGAHFALYRQAQTTSGALRKDYYPISGYEDLVSGEDGVIPGIDHTLRAGSYYLTEIQAPNGYEVPENAKDVLFTITDIGFITVGSGDGLLSGYVTHKGADSTIYIPNGLATVADLTVTKRVSGDMGDQSKRFSFRLQVEDDEEGMEYSWSRGNIVQETRLSNGSTFDLMHNETVTISLPIGKKIQIEEINLEEPYTTIYSTDDYLVATDKKISRGIEFTLIGNAKLIVENRLDAVAPTEHSDRVLPFALMLAAGVMALVISMRSISGKRRRNRD